MTAYRDCDRCARLEEEYRTAAEKADRRLACTLRREHGAAFVLGAVAGAPVLPLVGYFLDWLGACSAAGMNLFGLLLLVVIAGLALWLVNAYIPMAQPIKIILNVIVVLVLVAWLLSVFGLISDPHFHVGRFH
jgi:hypothetical protein